MRSRDRGPSDAAARHHTLRGTEDWSDQLLNGGEQACFARFAVFAGGATIEAAQTAMRSHALGAGPR